MKYREFYLMYLSILEMNWLTKESEYSKFKHGKGKSWNSMVVQDASCGGRYSKR